MQAFIFNMIHFPTTLKPIHNNLSIEKDKVSLTYETQDDDSLKKKGKMSELWVQVRNFPSIPQQPHYTSINSTPKPTKNRIQTP